MTYKKPGMALETFTFKPNFLDAELAFSAPVAEDIIDSEYEENDGLTSNGMSDAINNVFNFK